MIFQQSTLLLIQKKVFIQVIFDICKFNCLNSWWVNYYIKSNYQGLCVGVSSVLVPLLVKQFSPVQTAWKLGSMHQLMIALGITFSFFLQFIFSKIYKQEINYINWIFCFPILIILIQSIFLFFKYSFETPKYYLEHNKQKECKLVLEKLYRREYVQEYQFKKKCDLEIVRDIPLEENLLNNERFSSKRLFVAIYLMVLQQLSGINLIVVYGVEVIDKFFSNDHNKLISLLINIVQVKATLISGSCFNKYGRKQILQKGILFIIFSLNLIGIGFVFVGSQQSSMMSKIWIIIGLVIFMFVFGLSIGPVIWLYLPQILKQKYIPCVTSVNWLLASFIVTITPILQTFSSTWVVTFIFAICMAVGYLINRKYVLQTRGKIEKQIFDDYEKL